MEDKYNVTPEQYEEAVARVSKVHEITISNLNPEEQTFRAEGEVQNINRFWDDLENELVYLENGEDQEEVATEAANDWGRYSLKNFAIDKNGKPFLWGSDSSPAVRGVEPRKFPIFIKRKKVLEDEGIVLVHKEEVSEIENKYDINFPPEIENGSSATEEAEEEMYGFEAMSRNGMEELTSALAKALELFGPIETIRFIMDDELNLSSDYIDQLTFIKNTVDLSDINEVLKELVDTSETMLDDFQVQELAERVGHFSEEADKESEVDEEFGEYEEPEDWDSVDEPLPDEEVIEEEPVEDTLEDSDLEDGLNSSEEDEND